MRIDSTHDEHAKILRAHLQASQVEVRKITLHQVYLAQQVAPAA